MKNINSKLVLRSKFNNYGAFYMNQRESDSYFKYDTEKVL